MGKWKMVGLGEVCEILDHMRVPVTSSERKSGAYPYYGANGIQDYVDDYIFDDDLVLLAEDGGNFGSKDRPIAYRVSGKCWVNNHAHVLKPKKMLNVDYLCYSIMFYDVMPLISGTTRAKLNQAAMRKMTIPLPPLLVQQQIADGLDRAGVLIEKRKVQIDKLDMLMKSQFIEMFGSIHHSKLYPYVPIRDFTKVVSGGTPDRSTQKYWNNGSIRWVKTTELQNTELSDTEEKITQEGLDNSSAKLVPPNTVLIAMYGQGKTRGMTAFLTTESTTNQACACILPSESVNQRFVWHYLMLSYNELRNMAKGGNQPNLNSDIIKNFDMLMPPISLQNEFADFVCLIEAKKSLLQQSLAKLELNYKSLMQKCLRGEIF